MERGSRHVPTAPVLLTKRHTREADCYFEPCPPPAHGGFNSARPNLWYRYRYEDVIDYPTYDTGSHHRYSALRETRRNRPREVSMVPMARSESSLKGDTLDVSGTGLDQGEVEETKQETVESLPQFMQSVTASFIRFIFEIDSSCFRRLLWTGIWIICCGYALFNIHAAFSQYFLYDTASQLSFTQKTGDGLAMPAITICNMNKYRKSWMMEERNSVMRKYEMERVWGPELMMLAFNMSITPQDNAAAREMSVEDLERDAKHGIYDMFLDVSFDEKNLPLEEYPEHFLERSTELGICYTFNADGKKKVKRTGTDYGASFTININQSEYMETQESAGIKVMLHHYMEPPLIKEYGLAIPPGSEAYISTRTLELHNLGEPYLNSNCTSRPLKTWDYYTVAGCTLECHAQILDQTCKCKQSHMPNENINICNLYDHKNCTELEITKIHRGLYGDQVRNCWCIDACSSTSYEYSLSRAEYPSLAAARNILEAISDDFKTVQDLRENFIRLHVYFESLAIEKVQKVSAYTTMNLLGDVGGNLGLFIGANVATLAEIIDYIARAIYFRIKKTR